MAKDLKLSIVIGLKDRASKGLQAIGGQVKGMSSGLTASLSSSNKLFGGMARGIDSVGAVLTAVAPELGIPFMVVGTGVKAAMAGVQALGGIVARVFQAAGSIISTVAQRITELGRRAFQTAKIMALVGAGLAAEAIRRSVNAFADYNQAITNAGTVTGLMGAELEKAKEQLSEFGLSISRHMALLPTEIAKGFYGLASAGLSVNEVMKASPAILTLAEATMNDVGATTELVVGAVKSFRLGFQQTGRVVNAFAAGIGASMLNMERLGVAFPYVAASAANLNIPLERVIATLGVIVDRGIDASMAGTGLRMIFQRLLNPSNEAAKALQKYGLTTDDLNVSTKGFLPVLRKLQAANISVADVYKIFEARAANAFQVLMSAGVPAIEELEKKVTGTNRAFEMQEQQISTAQGVWNILKSTVQELSIRFGKALAPAFKAVSEWLQKVTERIIELKVMERAGAWVSSFVSVMKALFAPVANTVDKATGAFEKMAAVLSKVGGVGPKAKSSLTPMADALDKVKNMAGGATTSLAKFFGVSSEGQKAGAGGLGEGATAGMLKFAGAIKFLLFSLGRLGAAMAASFGGAAQQVAAGSSLADIIVGIVNSISAAVNWLTENVFAPGRIEGIVAWFKHIARLALGYGQLIVLGIQYLVAKLGGVQVIAQQIGGYFRYIVDWGKYLVGWMYTNLPAAIEVVTGALSKIATALVWVWSVGDAFAQAFRIAFATVATIVTGAGTVIMAVLGAVYGIVLLLVKGLNALSFGALGGLVKGMEAGQAGLDAMTEAFSAQTVANAKNLADAVGDLGRSKGKFAPWLEKAAGIETTGAGWAAGMRTKQAAWQQQYGIQATTVAPGPAAGYMPQQTNNFYIQGVGDEALLRKIEEQQQKLRREQRWSPVGG